MLHISTSKELLNLAEEYQDLTFKNFCDEYFNFNVEIDNVASLFDFAVKVNATVGNSELIVLFSYFEPSAFDYIMHF